MMDRADRRSFSHTGASHVLAISGMHVDILIAIIMMMISHGFVSRNRWIGFVLTACVLWCFAMIIGMPRSVVRACLAYTLMMLTYASRRKISEALRIEMAAMVMLVVDPYALFDLSFLLSFAAVCSIMTCAEWIPQLPIRVYEGWRITLFFALRDIVLPRWLHRLCKAIDLMINGTKHVIAQSIYYCYYVMMMSIAAQVFTAPIIIATFHEISIVGPIAGVPIVAAVTAFVPLAIILIAMTCVGVPSEITAVIANTINWLSECIYKVVDTVGSKEWSYVRIEDFGWKEIIFSYLVIFAFVWLIDKKFKSRSKRERRHQ